MLAALLVFVILLFLVNLGTFLAVCAIAQKVDHGVRQMTKVCCERSPTATAVAAGEQYTGTRKTH